MHKTFSVSGDTLQNDEGFQIATFKDKLRLKHDYITLNKPSFECGGEFSDLGDTDLCWECW